MKIMEKFVIILEDGGYNDDVGSYIKNEVRIKVEASSYDAAYDLSVKMAMHLGYSSGWATEDDE